MKRLVSTSYSHPHLLVRRVVASCIVLALFLSPFEVPLSELAVAPKTTPETAAESYEELVSHGTITSDPSGDITYTRGEAMPELALVSNLYSGPIVSEEGIPTASTTTEIPVEELMGEPKPPVKQLTARAQNNHAAARLLAEGKTGSELASVTLDAAGNIVATADIHGATETAEYNNDGQPIKITEGDGTTIYYKYDSDGRLLGVSREAKTVSASADSLPGLVSRFVAPLFALADEDEDTVGFDYEADSMTTAKNTVGAVEYEYDEDGLVTLETRLDGSQVEYEYDELGNVVTTIEIPADKGDSFSLRSFLRFSYASNPLLQTVQEFGTYDDNSRLTTYQIMSVTEAFVPEGPAAPVDTPVEALPTPNAAGTTTATSTEEITNTTSAVNDAVSSSTIDNVTPDTTPSTEQTPENVMEVPVIETVIEEIVAFVSGSSATIAYWFGSLLQRSFAEEATTTAETTTTPDSSTPSSVASSMLYSITFTYDAQGNVTSSETNAGIKTTYTYDSTTDSLVSTIVTSPNGQTSSHVYNADTQARLGNYNGNSYTYNEAGLLTEASGVRYTYDESGNRLETIGGNADAHTYSGNRLLTTTYANGRTVSYEYDDRGAVARIVDSSTGTTNFTYNLAGAITTIARGTEVISYEYDALNRRSGRTSAEGTSNYHYNSNQLKRITNEEGATIREYFYTPTGSLTAIKAGETIYHTITNYNRSLLGLIDTTTGTLYETTYDAWGNVTSNNLPITVDVGYIGAFAEPTLGYSILGPRVYDPEVGRFLSKDPLPGVQLDLLSQNEYIYAKNDPVNQYDPSGHASELATDSASPKRSLVETNSAIGALRTELADAEATLAITDPADAEAYSLAQLDITNLESALAELYAIRTDTEATIRKNEAEAAAALLPIPVTTEMIEAVWGTGEAQVTSSDTASPNTLDESTTTGAISTTENTGRIGSTTDTALIETTPSEEAVTEIPASPLDTVAPTNETTPALPVTVSFGITKGVMVLVSAVAGDQLLKAEAKKKKSKAKKSKKDKKKASEKAKSKKESKAKQLSSLKKKLNSLQNKLAATQKKNAKRKISKRELERINREVQSVAVSVLSLRVDDLVRQRDAASVASAERARQQALATAANNLAANTNAQIKTISVTPAAPAVTAVFGPTQAPQSAGVQAPRLSFEQPTVPWWKTATSVVVSLVPVVGEVYDGWTIYAQKDPITGERLTLLGNAFTVIGLGSIAGSGKVAREVGERAIREIATSKGIDYDLVNSAAEEVIKEADLAALAAKGKTGFDELLTKIGERALAKNLANLTAIATKIANGHAYTDHIHEFKHLGITSQSQFKEHVVKVLTNPSDSHTGKNGKKYFWHDDSKTFAVIDNLNPDMGTAFIPTRGKQYYLDQLVK